MKGEGVEGEGTKERNGGVRRSGRRGGDTSPLMATLPASHGARGASTSTIPTCAYFCASLATADIHVQLAANTICM